MSIYEPSIPKIISRMSTDISRQRYNLPGRGGQVFLQGMCAESDSPQTKPVRGEASQHAINNLRWLRRQLQFLILVCMAGPITASEFDIKRETVFEFVNRPVVAHRNGKVNITFEAKGACDVTVVIEDASGRTVRHLVSGVLGHNPPAPLQPNSLKQQLTWDSKDDAGEYVNDVASCSVRVSLGLKAEFEKVLLWEPKIRMQSEPLLMQATEEGVYVYDGRVLDHLRLYDHDGNYRRTIYPFPSNRLRDVKGIRWRSFPQDGKELPLKEGFHQATMLNSGSNSGFDDKAGIGVDVHNNYHGSVWGNAASAMAVRNGRIALARLRLNRLASDGTTGGFDLAGPEVTFPILPEGNSTSRDPVPVLPRSAALSPDGSWLYLAGYIHGHRYSASRDIVLIQSYDWLPVIARMKFGGSEKAEVFLGSPDVKDSGSGDAQFNAPTSIAVDEQGRLYISDYMNDRVQVFSGSGDYLKTIKVHRPAQVCLDQKNGHIYVFSWYVPAKGLTKNELLSFKPELTVLESVDTPKAIQTFPLPLGSYPPRTSGLSYRAEIDPWAKSPKIWLVSEWGMLDILTRQTIKYSNIQLFNVEEKQLTLVRDFNEDARKSVVRTHYPEYSRQRLYVNPANGHLYVGEGQAAVGKSFKDLIEVDPESGKVGIVNLPFDAEDMCFDNQGLAYLRTFYHVARYDSNTWREVPFDYGEEKDEIRTGSSRDAQPAKALSALRLPVKNAGLHHHGGMAVSPNGNLIVAINNYGKEKIRRKDIYDEAKEQSGAAYTPRIYPGRLRWGEVHIWDKHGTLLYEDAVPGIGRADGLGIDREDNIYLLSTAARVMDGKRYFNDMTETLIKVKPQKAKAITPSLEGIGVPLQEDLQPRRNPDLQNGQFPGGWVENAEWFYGGLGFGGKSASRSGGGCDCYNARFTLDSLGRSFAPELDHFSIAVLDTNGNLIMRIGQYGNADSSGPDSPVPLGGDEVGLMHAAYLATYTDRRLFVADAGNARILSVKLDYHVTERVKL